MATIEEYEEALAPPGNRPPGNRPQWLAVVAIVAAVLAIVLRRFGL